MRLSFYTALIILFTSILSASELISPALISSSDNNISVDINTTIEEEEVTAKNWFFYRNFLTTRGLFYYQDFLKGVDTVHSHGTDAVIVVGSGIDYSLYNLLGHDGNITKPAKPKQAVTKKEEKSILQKGISSDTDKNIAQYVSSKKGETDLPKQLTSRNPRKGERTYLISEWFADQNIDDDFLDKTNHSYVRLRGGFAYSFRADNEYIYSITARLKIPRTQEKLDLIIGDDTKNSSDLSLEGTEAERDSSIALGINNVLGLLKPVDTKIRLGFSGITNPYAKAAFTYEALVDRWLIIPHQTFRYSVEDEFEEWTNLNVQRRVVNETMFSILFQRSTISSVDGMNYFVQPSLNLTFGKYGNFTPYLGMYGRTKEQPAMPDGHVPKRGVYRYAVGLNWSKQASRRYIVYRLQPILSYDDQYQFRPNYFVKALLEFYFGLQD